MKMSATPYAFFPHCYYTQLGCVVIPAFWMKQRCFIIVHFLELTFSY